MPSSKASIAVLIGAGFSAPMGYPIGDKLNQLVLNCTGDEFTFGPDGSLIVSSDGQKPDIGYVTNWENNFQFCIKLISYFNQCKGYFDYEEFFDFIKDQAINDPQVLTIATPFMGDLGNIKSLIYSLYTIYPHIILYYLKDENGIRYYDTSGHSIGLWYDHYLGILNCLKKLLEHYYLNIHTLNHDLFCSR